MSSQVSVPGASKSELQNNNCVDRLSSLPDELLHHVMSFLTMLEVVRMSLLSLRWRNLWASTTFIHIYYHDFKDENNPLGVDDEKPKEFGDHLLLLRDDSVCLDEAESSLLMVVAGRVLCGFVMPSSTKFVSSMFLDRTALLIWIAQQELKNCSLIGVNEISSGSLKVLHMIRCFNASVILSSEKFNFPIDTIVYGHRLLDGLSHAITLELHAPLHKLALERGLQTCPMFINLTRLVLGDWCMAADFYPLLHILQGSRKLIELNLKLKMEECSICKDSESVLSSSRATSLTMESYPSLERIKICLWQR